MVMNIKYRSKAFKKHYDGSDYENIDVAETKVNRLEGVTLDIGDKETPNITPQEKDDFRKFLEKNHKCFATDRSNLGKNDQFPQSINIKPGTTPIASRHYRVNPIMQHLFDEEISQLLRKQPSLYRAAFVITTSTLSCVVYRDVNVLKLSMYMLFMSSNTLGP